MILQQPQMVTLVAAQGIIVVVWTRISIATKATQPTMSTTTGRGTVERTTTTTTVATVAIAIKRMEMQPQVITVRRSQTGIVAAMLTINNNRGQRKNMVHKSIYIYLFNLKHIDNIRMLLLLVPDKKTHNNAVSNGNALQFDAEETATVVEPTPQVEKVSKGKGLQI